ncbi:MAG: hypothetical protein BZ136_03395 [Methanosphaera sp. rholeuAM74]|nr:MAG: hypothetical protein BZ136_03395 [Methanosphaera sp. rholeuAM74]
MTEYIRVNGDELLEYMHLNFCEGALVEISYNRVFIPARIVLITYEPELVLTLQLQGELLNQCVDVVVSEIIDDIVELNYVYDGKEVVLELYD